MEIKKINLPKKVGKAYIIDDVFEYHDIRNIYSAVLNERYTFTQMSEPFSNVKNTRLAVHLEPGEGVEPLLAKTAFKILKKFKMHKDFQISEMYVNMADAMTVTLPHTDRPEGCWTLLYFPNYEWDIKYGGQTNFIDADMEIVGAVIPRPGRFILFKANILHQATPPTFYCPFKRFTIAFKLDPIFEQDPEGLEQSEPEGEKYVTTNSCWNK